jgi:hypothetical protein
LRERLYLGEFGANVGIGRLSARHRVLQRVHQLARTRNLPADVFARQCLRHPGLPHLVGRQLQHEPAIVGVGEFRKRDEIAPGPCIGHGPGTLVRELLQCGNLFQLRPARANFPGKIGRRCKRKIVRHEGSRRLVTQVAVERLPRLRNGLHALRQVRAVINIKNRAVELLLHRVKIVHHCRTRARKREC